MKKGKKLNEQIEPILNISNKLISGVLVILILALILLVIEGRNFFTGGVIGVSSIGNLFYLITIGGILISVFMLIITRKKLGIGLAALLGGAVALGGGHELEKYVAGKYENHKASQAIIVEKQNQHYLQILEEHNLSPETELVYSETPATLGGRRQLLRRKVNQIREGDHTRTLIQYTDGNTVMTESNKKGEVNQIPLDSKKYDENLQLFKELESEKMFKEISPNPELN